MSPYSCNRHNDWSHSFEKSPLKIWMLFAAYCGLRYVNRYHHLHAPLIDVPINRSNKKNDVKTHRPRKVHRCARVRLHIQINIIAGLIRYAQSIDGVPKVWRRSEEVRSREYHWSVPVARALVQHTRWPWVPVRFRLFGVY